MNFDLRLIGLVGISTLEDPFKLASYTSACSQCL